MEKDRLRELLKNLLELEGLVRVALDREQIPSDLNDMIREKGADLREYFPITENSLSGQSLEPVADEKSLVTSETIETKSQEVEADNEDNLNYANESEPEDFLTTETFSEEDYIAEESEEELEEVYSEEPEESETEESGLNDNFFEYEIPEYVIEDDEDASADQISPEHGVVIEDLPSVSPKARGRLVFSINDRYRFRKELFNNSDVDFNTTMACVASMENYEEAEDYFIEELGMDEKNPDVIDFLAIIKKYFN